VLVDGGEAEAEGVRAALLFLGDLADDLDEAPGGGAADLGLLEAVVLGELREARRVEVAAEDEDELEVAPTVTDLRSPFARSPRPASLIAPRASLSLARLRRASGLAWIIASSPWRKSALALVACLLSGTRDNWAQTLVDTGRPWVSGALVLGWPQPTSRRSGRRGRKRRMR
jgi:hypothetical protein